MKPNLWDLGELRKRESVKNCVTCIFCFVILHLMNRDNPIRANITLSFAYSKSSTVTILLFFLEAIKAASLTRLAKSAPEKPGVPLAIIFESNLAYILIRYWSKLATFFFTLCNVKPGCG